MTPGEMADLLEQMYCTHKTEGPMVITMIIKELRYRSSELEGYQKGFRDGSEEVRLLLLKILKGAEL